MWNKLSPSLSVGSVVLNKNATAAAPSAIDHTMVVDGSYLIDDLSGGDSTVYISFGTADGLTYRGLLAPSTPPGTNADRCNGTATLTVTRESDSASDTVTAYIYNIDGYNFVLSPLDVPSLVSQVRTWDFATDFTGIAAQQVGELYTFAITLETFTNNPIEILGDDYNLNQSNTFTESGVAIDPQ